MATAGELKRKREPSGTITVGELKRSRSAAPAEQAAPPPTGNPQAALKDMLDTKRMMTTTMQNMSKALPVASRPDDEVGPEARKRAYATLGAPTLQDAQDPTVPTMAFNEARDRAQAAARTAQLENDRRQREYAESLARKEVASVPGSAAPSEWLSTVGPGGMGGVQLQSFRGSEGQIGPDEDVDLDIVRGTFTDKLAPRLFGAGSAVQQGAVRVAKTAYDPGQPQGQRWFRGQQVAKDPAEKSRGVTSYLEQTGRNMGETPEGAAAGLQEQTLMSKALAVPAAAFGAWNAGVEAPATGAASAIRAGTSGARAALMRGMDAAAGGPATVMPREPEATPNTDMQQADQWFNAARELWQGGAGALEGAQISDEERQAVGQDARGLVGRTLGTAVGMASPTEANLVGPAVKVMGAAVGPTLRSAYGTAMKRPGFEKAMHAFNDTPWVPALKERTREGLEFAQDMRGAEELNRTLDVARQQDAALEALPWWKGVPLVDRQRLLLPSNVAPSSPAGKRAFQILREADEAQHSAATQMAASPEAQQALEALAPVAHRVRLSAAPDVEPAPFHAIYGQDFTQEGNKLATLAGPGPKMAEVAPEQFAQTPTGRGLMRSGDVRVENPRAAVEQQLAEAPVASELDMVDAAALSDKAQATPAATLKGAWASEARPVADTRAARMQEAQISGASPREIRRLQEELDLGNLARGITASAKSTATVPARVTFLKELERSLPDARAEYPGYFEPFVGTKGVPILKYNRAPAGGFALSPEDIAKLKSEDAVLLQVRNASSKMDDAARVKSGILADGDVTTFIDLPPGVDATQFHGMKVPRAYARALVDSAEQATDFAKELNDFLGTAQMTRALTIGRAGFQAKNLVNETARVMAEEPGFFRSKTPKILTRIMNAADDTPIPELGGARAGEVRRVLIGGSGVGRGFVGSATKASEEAPSIGAVRGAANMLRDKGMKRTGNAVDRAQDAFDAGVETLNKPGMAVNNTFERAWNRAAGFGDIPGFNAEDKLRAGLMLHKMLRGASVPAASRASQAALINFGKTNNITRIVKPAVPFINYYAGSVRGALRLAVTRPQQYRHLAQFVNAQEQADAVANNRTGRVFNPKLKSDEELLGTMAVTQDGDQWSARGLDYTNTELSQLNASRQSLMPSEDGGRSAAGLLSPVLTQFYSGYTGRDAASGRSVLGLDKKEHARVMAEAEAAYPWAKANMPFAMALWLRGERQRQGLVGGAPLGENPDAALAYYAATGFPGVGRFTNQPQVRTLARWGSGAEGNNPATLDEESRSSEYMRAWQKVLGANVAPVQPMSRAQRSATAAGEGVVDLPEVRRANDIMRGKNVPRKKEKR